MDGADSVLHSITSVFQEPVVLLLAVVAMTLAYTHAQDPATSLLKTIAEEIRKVDAISRFADVLLRYELKILGFAVMLPSLLSIRGKWRTTFFALAGLTIWLLPPKGMWVYAAASLFLRTYFRTNAMGKVVLAILVAALVIWSPSEIAESVTASTTPRSNTIPRRTTPP